MGHEHFYNYAAVINVRQMRNIYNIMHFIVIYSS